MRDNFENTRYYKRKRKRKTNFILNSLIVIVLALIIIVSGKIFFGEDETSAKKEDSKVEQQNVEKVQENEKSEKDSVSETAKREQTFDEEAADEATSLQTEPIVTEGGDDPNVLKTIVNPSWEPVGTVQTGEHVNVYSGVDWDEMVKAISYATGLDENNMTIYFLGNNGPNKSVGTVYTKDKKEIYRVYIEWVDHEGWKPTKVEQLASIPKSS